MPGIKVDISANTSDLDAALRKVEETLKRINQPGVANATDVDTQAATRQLDDLQKAAQRVKESLSAVAAPDLGAAGTQATRSLGEAQKAVDALQQKLDALGRMPGPAAATKSIDDVAEAARRAAAATAELNQATERPTPTVDRGADNARRQADELQRAARIQQQLGRDGIQITREQASATQRAYDTLRTSGVSGSRPLRSIELDDFLGGGYRRTALDPQDAERKRRQVMEYLGRETGIDALAHPASTEAPAQSGVAHEEQLRRERIQRQLEREGIRVGRERIAVTKREIEDIRETQARAARGSGRNARVFRALPTEDILAGNFEGLAEDPREAQRLGNGAREHLLKKSRLRSRPGSRLARIMGSRRMGALAGVAGGVLASGNVSGMLGEAGAAAGSGLGAVAGLALGGPVGAAVGFFASKLLGGAGSAVGSRVGAATQEAEMYHDLRMAVGPLTTDFMRLRDSVRFFGHGLGLADNQLAQYARVYAGIAGGTDADLIGRRVGQAAGFARGFGADPQTAVQFFATMQRLGMDRRPGDDRRLALQIAGALQRGGTTAQFGQVLSALNGMAVAQSRLSLTRPNVAGMAQFMSMLTSSGVPGLSVDPQASASIMQRITAALSHGGAAGRASRVFSMAAYQSALGPAFNAFDAPFIDEAGPFTDVGVEYAAKLARDNARAAADRRRGNTSALRSDEDSARHDRAMESAGRGKTSLGMTLSLLRRQYAGQPRDVYLQAMARQLGISENQADVVDTELSVLGHGSVMGGADTIARTLHRLHIDPTTLRMRNIGAVAQAMGLSGTQLTAEAKKLLALDGSRSIGADAQKAIRHDLSTGNVKTLRDDVIRAVATHDTTQDAGQQARQQRADMLNELQRLAAGLIGPTAAVQGGIAELVRHFAPNSPEAKRLNAEDAVRNAEQVLHEIPAQDNAAAKRLTEQEALKHGALYLYSASKLAGLVGETVNDAREARQSAVNAANKAITAANADPVAGLQGMPQIDAYGRVKGHPGATGSWDIKPSGSSGSWVPSRAHQDASPHAGHLDPTAFREPLNLLNDNPGNIRYGAFARRLGATGENHGYAVFASRGAGSRAMDALLKSYVSRGYDTLSKIIHRWAPSADDNDPDAYAKAVSKWAGVGINTPLSAGDTRTLSRVAQAMSRFEGSARAYVAPRPIPREYRQRDRAAVQQTAYVGGAFNGTFRLVDERGHEVAPPILQTVVGAPQPFGVAV